MEGIQTTVAEAINRIGLLEQTLTAAINLPDGRTLTQTVINGETTTSTLQTSINDILAKLAAMDDMVDAEIKTAMQFSGSKSKDDGFFKKPILESKAVSDLASIIDSKTYRQWNRKAKNAIEQTRPDARSVMEMLESITESDITN